MSGTIPVLSLHAFMERTGKTLPLWVTGYLYLLEFSKTVLQVTYTIFCFTTADVINSLNNFSCKVYIFKLKYPNTI
jgi:hypothetical protein